MSRLPSAAIILCAATALAACKGKSDGGTGVAGSILITPKAAALCIGDSLAFIAQVLEAAGNPVPAAKVRWSSSAPNAASIDTASGMARALEFVTGAQITATSGGIQSAQPASLDVPGDLSPEFVPDAAVLAPGDTMTIGVRLRRTASTGPVPARTPVIAPLDTTVASLAASGLVTAKAAGTASFSLGACGLTGHGAVQVFTPPDSATGLGYLWLSGPAELRVSLGTVATNYVLTSQKRAFQIYGSTNSKANQFAYEDTLPLKGPGVFPVDSLSSTEVGQNITCAPPRPFAVYGASAPLTSITSMRGGSAAVTTYTSHTTWSAISGRVTTQMQGIVNGVASVVTLRAIFSFSAPLRDSTNACP